MSRRPLKYIKKFLLFAPPHPKSENLFCCCNNNPITSSDEDEKDPGTSYIHEISLGDHLNIDPLQNEFIYYVVPLYNQGNTRLCWAYCQLMIESYQNGVVLSPKEAKAAAIELGKVKHGEKNWNNPGWPSNLGSSYTVNDIEDIFIALKQQNGPVYAYYEGKNVSHLVVVTGVDVRNDVIYTNNSWGTHGEQTFSQFSKRPAKKIYDIVPALSFRKLFFVKENN